jgi:hypothetical protein
MGVIKRITRERRTKSSYTSLCNSSGFTMLDSRSIRDTSTILKVDRIVV